MDKKQHKKFETIIAYFKEIPLDEELIKLIESLLAVKKYVHIIMLREDPEDNPRFTEEEKFKALCKKFPNETKACNLIITKCFDLGKIYRFEK